MVKIEIVKNGKVIKEFVCPVTQQQKTFARAHGIAGGMWNGVDEFKVRISKVGK